MKILTLTLFIWINLLRLSAQTPQLIFHSGFEPNTNTIGQSSNGVDIQGVDNSFNSNNDWETSLEGAPNNCSFNIQYQGGNDTMRLAEIATDPVNPSNKVLHFWIKYPNVPVDSRTYKGRIQANLYSCANGFNNLYYSIRLFLPNDLDTLKFVPYPVKWFTLMEFWNNPNWLGDSYPFRITINLTKANTSIDSLRFSAHGQVHDKINNVWINVWDTTNSTFAVPTGKWMTIKLNYIEGNNTTGKLYMSVRPDGDTETVVINVTNYTFHPNDPSPDGLTYYNPFKLYTSGALIDSLRNWGKLTHVYWDDFELWNDSNIVSGVPELSLAESSFYVYPNPSTNNITFEFTDRINENRIITIYNPAGQLIKAAETSDKVVTIDSKKLTKGIYFYQIRRTNDKKIIGQGKFIVQ